MKEFYNATEAARLLKVSEKTIAKRCKSGIIPATRGRNENNVEVWQIAADYVNRLIDKNAINEPEYPEPESPEPVPEDTGTDADLLVDTIPEPDSLNNEGAAVMVPEPDTGIAPERTGTELARVVASHDVQLSELRGVVTGRAMRLLVEMSLQVGQMSEINRAQVEAMQAQAATLARMEKRLEESEAAREAAKEREEKLLRTVTEMGDTLASVKAEIEAAKATPEQPAGFLARLFGKR